jgi:hypothetical protein
MARRFGISKQAVSQIRLGRICRSIAPDLPRRAPAKLCTGCRFWRGGSDPCSQGMPDPVYEGKTFAADCDLFEQRRSTKPTGGKFS